jgi:hypothetical protein
MITLNFNDSIFYRSACATFFLEYFGKFFEFGIIQGNAGNYADTAAFSSFGLPAYPHQTINGELICLLTAIAPFYHIATCGAERACFG